MATTPTVPASTTTAPAAAVSSTSTSPAVSSPQTSTPATTSTAPVTSHESSEGHAAPSKSPAQILADKIAEGLGMDKQTGEINPDALKEKPAQAAETAEDGTTTAESSEQQQAAENEQGIAPPELASEIEADPAVKDFFETHSELKEKIFENARKAALTEEFQQIYATPDEARYSAEQHGKFSQLKQVMGSVDGTPATAAEFINAMVAETYLLDENGAPRKNANGQLIHDGSVYKFLKGAYQLRMDNLKAKYTKENNDAGVAAIDFLMESQGFTPRTGGEQNEDLPEHLRAEAARIEQEKKSWSEQKAREQQERRVEFEDSVDVATGEVFDSEIAKYVKEADGLSDPNGAIEEIKELLTEKLNGKATFTDKQEELFRRGMTPKVKAELVALRKLHMNAELPKIAAQVLARRGSTEIDAQKYREQQQAKKVENSRSEARTGTGSPARPQSPSKMDGAQLRSHVTQELTKKLGRTPSDVEVTTGVMQARLSNAA